MFAEDHQTTRKVLLHFTDKKNMVSILSQGVLKPGDKELGVYPIPDGLRDMHKSVCFTELAPPEATEVARRRGKWGIAIHQEALVDSGANRVRYLNESETAHRQRLQSTAELDVASPFWQESPFLSPALPNYKFEWEREWRHPGCFYFDWTMVEYLIAPDGENMQLIPEEELGEFAYVIDQSVPMEEFVWVDGASRPFNIVMRGVLDRLHSEFVSPHEAPFFYDSEDPTGYAWPTEKWDIWEVLEYLLPPVPDNICEQLVYNLDSQSHFWARSDWEDDLLE